MTSLSDSSLSPPSRDWFAQTYGEPSPVQARVWPLIRSGKTVLFSSPTGTGKTLAAFMTVLDRLLAGDWEGGCVRVLYISPLKALNTDIRLNLLQPLAGLNEAWKSRGLSPRSVRIMTRSGDSPAKERRQLDTFPPEILITTPESLGVLLSRQTCAELFGGLKIVILDEIHALMESKRGSLLSLLLEKLELLAPGMQRVGISATVKPIDEAAHFLAGWQADPAGRSAMLPRPVVTIQEKGLKTYEIQVAQPRLRPLPEEDQSHYWEALGLELRKVVKENTRTLIFCNSRRVCETLARYINGVPGPSRSNAPGILSIAAAPSLAGAGREDQETITETLVYPHHGSLSRELRQTVEAGLKEGRLRGIVATSSLELGIDIGDLDLVVLVQAPASTASALQRAGRSGHRLGAASRLLIYPTHGLDALRCAVLARSVADQDLEELRIPQNPLDVLAQGLLVWCLDREWTAGELFAQVRASHVFHDLPRAAFDGVVDLLFGRYGDLRLKELQARLVEVPSTDVHARDPDGLPEPGRDNMRFTAVENARALLFSRGGTIPGRGSYVMRGPGDEKLGELDEEFIWERRKGDRFFLGNRVWEIFAMDEQTVRVRPSSGFAMIPFWRGEELDLSFALSRRVAGLMEYAQANLDRGSSTNLVRHFQDQHFFQASAALELSATLEGQWKDLGALSTSRLVMVEEIKIPEREGEVLWILQTFWGNKVNRPFCLLLQRAWQELCGQNLEYYLGNEGLLLILPEGQALQEILDQALALDVEAAIRAELGASVWFASRFRENAGRAMLLGGGFGKRMPLWLLRKRSAQLLGAVGRYPEFPILAETWRQCLVDELDLPSLSLVLSDLRQGSIKLQTVRKDEASPFAQSLIWKHTNALMYQPDGVQAQGVPSSRPAPGHLDSLEMLWADAFQDTSILPALDKELLALFEARLRPDIAGSSALEARPDSDPDQERRREILDFLHRAKFLGKDEWLTLVQKFEGGFSPREAEVRHNLAAPQSFHRLLADCRKDSADPDALDRLALAVLDYLSFSGPRSLAFLAGVLDLDASRLREILSGLLDAGEVLEGAFSVASRTSGAALSQSDAQGAAIPRLSSPGTVRENDLQWTSLELVTPDNLEYLHRLRRRGARQVQPDLSVPAYARFLAAWSGLGKSSCQDQVRLRSTLRRISAYPLAQVLWEREILPLRFGDWQPAVLDSLCLSQGLAWKGSGGKSRHITWILPGDEWFQPALAPPSALGEALASDQALDGEVLVCRIWTDQRPRDFSEIQAMVRQSTWSQTGAAAIEAALWDGVWKGLVSNQDPAVLRQAQARNFSVLSVSSEQAGEGRSRSPSFREWERHRLSRGKWYPLSPAAREGEDPQGEAEILKERCRLLLDRYGIVHPALLRHEAPGYRWQDLSYTFRLMELSGEIEAGFMVQGGGGLQYAFPAALTFARAMGPRAGFYLQAATDPTSLCASGLMTGLPPRKSGTWLVWQDDQLLWIWQDSGRLARYRPEENGSAAGDLPEKPSPVMVEALGFLFAELDRIDLSLAVAGGPGSGQGAKTFLKTLDDKPILSCTHWLLELGHLGFRRHGQGLIRFRGV